MRGTLKGERRLVFGEEERRGECSGRGQAWSKGERELAGRGGTWAECARHHTYTPHSDNQLQAPDTCLHSPPHMLTMHTPRTLSLQGTYKHTHTTR